MVIQEAPLQSAPNTELACRTFAPEALAPAAHFVSGFTASTAGFSPTSILIEIFGALAESADNEAITSGILLGLSGIGSDFLTPQQADTLLQTIRTTKSLHLNDALEVPFIPSEHLVLTPSRPDGIRLTAYHCVHPFETRQYTATLSPLTFTEC